MKRPSRRATVIASVSAFTVLVLAAGTLVGFSVKADADARAAHDAASARNSTATTSMNTARHNLTIAQNSALFTVRNGSTLADAADPTLISDSTTVDALRAAIATLATTAGLVDTDGILSAPPSLPRITAPIGVAPTERDVLVSRAAALDTSSAQLEAQIPELVTETASITAAIDSVRAAETIVAGSAYAFGSTAVPPSRASTDSVTAFTAAVDALQAPPAGADLAALVVAYRDAWNATVASDAAARSTTGAAAPTYIKGVLIVNKTYGLPSTFGNGLTTETKDAFAAMQAAAAAQGHNIYISSGFRSFASQTAIYNRYKANEGQDGADRHSARPGHSEHQSGLTFDLNTITEAFGSTPEGIWVRDNAHLYGFIVRYPPGKEAITGYVWEPWHLRYLGTDLATTLYNSGQTLEEYLGVTSVYN